jgi:hypothetical protein
MNRIACRIRKQQSGIAVQQKAFEKWARNQKAPGGNHVKRSNQIEGQIADLEI